MSVAVWITGASEGIGRACAEKFAAQGASLALCARRKGPLEALGEKLRDMGAGEVFTRVADVSKGAQLAAFGREALDALGGVDVLVNNAGGGGPGRSLTESDEAFEADWRYAVDTNLMAPMRLVRLALVPLRASQGVIINVSSAWSFSPASFAPLSYAATKAGLNVITHELARDLGPDGIRVVGVAPGPVWTESWERDAQEEATATGKSLDEVRAATAAEVGRATKIGRPGTPEEIAALIVFLASSEAAFVSGTTILADGGYVHSVS